MSDTFAVEVLRVDGDALELRLSIVHPDVTHFPETPSFALQCLMAPLADPLDEVLVSGTTAGSLYAALERAAAARPARTEKWVYRERWIAKSARDIVRSVSILEERRPGTEDGALAEADLEIVVTDPRWLDHLREGDVIDGIAPYDLTTRMVEWERLLERSWDTGAYEDVLEIGASILGLDPWHGNARFMRARAYQERGDPSRALHEIDVALEIDPRDWSLRHERAVSLLALDRNEEARSELDAVIEAAPEEVAVAYRIDRAAARERLGDRLGAIADLEAGLAHEPTLAERIARLREG